MLSSQVAVWRAKSAHKSSTFPRDYLGALVCEIRVRGETLTMAGSYGLPSSIVTGAPRQDESGHCVEAVPIP